MFLAISEKSRFRFLRESEMAKENKSNETSTSHSEKAPANETSTSQSHTEKASAPSPSSLILPSFVSSSGSPETAPSKSPPPSPPTSPPPSSPPPQSHSPPPSPSPSPSPPPKSQSPPPQSLPPPSSPPPSKGSTPPPSPSPPPPTPPSQSPPPQSPTPSTPSPNGNSPPPSQSTSPSPPPPVQNVPSSSSQNTPSPPPWTSPPTGSSGQNNNPSPLQSPPPVPPGSRSKPSASPSKSTAPSTSPTSGDKTGQYVGFAFATAFAVAFVAAILFFVLRRKDKRAGNVYAMPPFKKSQMKGGDVHYYVEDPGFGNGAQDGFYSAGAMLRSPSDPAQQLSAGPIVFTYDKIVEITNGFSSENVIGEGGFGRVYKASMADGRVGAIKLLKAGSGQGEREFKAEVEIISRVHHRHLVSLIGYCISEKQRVLIYEYVPNGNLDQHLHASGRVLDWPKRMKIAIGAARGLAYLHEGCNPRIIHRDIKSANILLDDAYEAQVADFGLARLTDDANTHVSTRVMGTFGYMAPEYATSGKLTDRSDVFSFGVVLLELVTGRKPVDPTQPVGDESLVEWARPLLLRAIETGDFGELADRRLERQYVDSEMLRMIEAAAACVRHSGPKRPSMVQVARALDSGDQLYDLSNGVKYGQSTVYDSGMYNEDIMRFRRIANGSFDDSEYDMYSTEYSSASADMSGSTHAWIPHSSSVNSDIRAFQGQRGSASDTGFEGTQMYQ